MSSLVKACGRLTLELETLHPRSLACLAFSSRSTIIVRATGTRHKHSLGKQYYLVSGGKYSSQHPVILLIFEICT